MVTLTINEVKISVEAGTTILDAGKQAGFKIPTLCVLKDVIKARACRLCVVEIEGQDRLAPACGTFVEEGMVVKTNTLKVIEARRQNLRLILSQHNAACTTCIRSTHCELQTLASDLNMPEAVEESPRRSIAWPKNQYLQRDSTKCIMCMRCVGVCDRVQTCHVWDILGTGSYARVDVREGKSLEEANCSFCGQCIINCPVGALSARDDTDEILKAIADPDVITAINVAPAVRSAWGEPLGLSHDEASEPLMVAAMKALGFDYVFDTNYAADLTIMEEGAELLDRIMHADEHTGPMFTSCCPGWVRFVKQNYQEYLPNLSTAKSPHQMLGAIAKTYFAKEQNIDPQSLFMVSVMPCVAKKYEASMPQLADAGADHDIDAVITTRELVRLLKTCSLDVRSLKEAEWDYPFGMSTGAGAIFGRSGGVMEAVLRTVAYLITGKAIPLEDTALDTMHQNANPWIEKSMQIGDQTVNIAVVSGLGNARQLLDALTDGRAKYDFVEVMACPGGCINGGGQPIVMNKSTIDQREQVLNMLDCKALVRSSYENKDVQHLYKVYLENPNSTSAYQVLHTNQVP